jgi:hypothetical protein
MQSFQRFRANCAMGEQWFTRGFDRRRAYQYSYRAAIRVSAREYTKQKEDLSNERLQKTPERIGPHCSQS